MNIDNGISLIEKIFGVIIWIISFILRNIVWVLIAIGIYYAFKACFKLKREIGKTIERRKEENDRTGKSDRTN
jgi:hypothetical protein